jgi:hypothetical protein
MQTQYLTRSNADPAEACRAVFHAQPLRGKTGERMYKALNLWHHLEGGNIEFWAASITRKNDAC